jgi:hypothetical protein
MKAIKFTGCNVVYGANQPEYLPLPAMKMPDGEVITCWELSDEEIEVIRKNKCIYFSQLTFNSSLQPVRAMVELSDNLEITE